MSSLGPVVVVTWMSGEKLSSMLCSQKIGVVWGLLLFHLDVRGEVEFYAVLTEDRSSLGPVVVSLGCQGRS